MTYPLRVNQIILRSVIFVTECLSILIYYINTEQK
jgi:hypothetical protein